MEMPWGKFKGKQIEEVPSGYLKWLAENCEDDTICNAADEEYRWRTDNHEHFWD
jgi:hypothetical protein